MNQKKEPGKGQKGGRPEALDPARKRESVNFTDQEYAQFLAMFDQSGVHSKSAFIKARVFDQVFRVVTTDSGTLEYVAKLTSMHSQFRSVGVNYNQVVKELHSHFSEKRALALLYKLEKQTIELARIGQQIIALCSEFQTKYLGKKHQH